MNRLFKRFARDASGVTAIEYGLIVAGISLAIVTAMTTVGNDISAVFNSLSGNLK